MFNSRLTKICPERLAKGLLKRMPFLVFCFLIFYFTAFASDTNNYQSSRFNISQLSDKEQSQFQVEREKKIQRMIDRGYELFVEGNYRGAEIEFENVLNIHTKNPISQKYYQIASTYYNKSKQLSDELNEFRKNKSPDTKANEIKSKDYFKLGKEAFKKKDYEQARLYFEKALILSPTDKGYSKYVKKSSEKIEETFKKEGIATVSDKKEEKGKVKIAKEDKAKEQAEEKADKSDLKKAKDEKKQQEALEKKKAEEEMAKKEAMKKAEEEKEKQEVLAKQKAKDEEKEKKEALKKEEEEKEKQEKLAKEKAKEEEDARKEAAKKAEEEKGKQEKLAKEKEKAEAEQKAALEKVEKEKLAKERIVKEKVEKEAQIKAEKEAQAKVEREAKEQAEKEAKLKVEKETQEKAKLEAKKEAEETLKKKEIDKKLVEEKAEKERMAVLNKQKEKEEAERKAKFEAEEKTKEEAEQKAKEKVLKEKKIEVAQVKEEQKPEVKKIEAEKDINKEKSQATLEEGERLLDEGKYEEAIAKFDESNNLFENKEALKLKKIAQTNIDEKQKQARQEQLRIQKEKEEEEARINEKQSKVLCEEGINLYKNAQYDQAIAKLDEAVKLNPKNTIAETYLARAKEEQQIRLDEMGKKAEQVRTETAEALFSKGKEEYEKGNIATARENWEKALTNNPEHKKAATYLAQTEAEYQEFLKKQQIEKGNEKKKEEIKTKLKTLITMETHEDTPIQDFMKNLSLISGITFSFSEGVSGKVNGKFEENTLEEVLNAILKPNGLKWSVTEGNIILIESDLQTKIFQLKTKDQIERVKTLYDNKFIHRLIYGEKMEPPIKGCEITLDEREGILMVVGSQTHIDKVEALLANLPERRPLVLDTQSFIVSKDKGEYTKDLVENFLRSKADPATYLEGRKVLYEDGTLIIIDTPDNIKLVENLLSDKDLLETIKRERLEIRTFKVLTPELMEENPEVAQSFLSNVEEMIRTKLYSVEGQKVASEKGRRLWVNPAFGTITIVDSPDNVDAIGTFISTLPTIERMPLVEILYLKYQTASDVETKIKDFLGISGVGAAAAPAAGGLSTTIRLSGDSKAKWRDLQIQLIRVNENDANLDNDESVELFITTPDNEQDVTIQELRSQRVGDYRIRVDDAKATGRGRCTLLVEYLGPQGGTGYGYGAPITTPTTPTITAEVPAEMELNITSDDTTNAIIVQTADPLLLSRIKEIIKKVDIPILQAQIEIKFVEVNETRAKELGIDFSAADLSSKTLSGLDEGRGIMRFAQDLDEFMNPFEPFAENLTQTNLIKGVTVLKWASDRLSITLRSLEAEGILNIISGPKITTKNGNDANFTITKTFWYVTSISGAATTWANQSIDLVDFSVTPTISMEGTIALEIAGTVSEFMPGTQGFMQFVPTGVNAPSQIAFTSPSYWQYQLVEKEIDTEAIIQDGETMVLGGWTSERARESTSGVPVLRHIPYVGPIIFGRSQKHLDKTTLLIFLTGYIVKPEER